jgi:hypothetical protein
MPRLTMLLGTALLAGSLLTVGAQARGGGDVGNSHVALDDHTEPGNLGIRHHATHRFGGAWPGYPDGLYGDGAGCADLYPHSTVPSWRSNCS